MTTEFCSTSMEMPAMNRSLTARLVFVVTVAGSAFLFKACAPDNAPYPISLTQLQDYSPGHDFADRAALVSGTLQREGDDFAISDEVDGS